MNCEEARNRLGAEPHTDNAELTAHLSTCLDCQSFVSEARAFEARLRRALELDPQVMTDLRRTARPQLPPEATLGRPSRVPRVWAIAASLAAAVVVAATLWVARPKESLAAQIVEHVTHEASSWDRREPLSAAELEAVLRKSHVQMAPGPGTVVYAKSCWFRGHWVPHLVVTTAAGPVTVMILTEEHVEQPLAFAEDGYSGLLVPAPTGSVAVLSRKPIALQQPAADVLRALKTGN
jgi:hypothetical protein